MKKTIRVLSMLLMLAVLSVSMMSGETFAKEKINKSDYKQLMITVKEMVKEGNGEQVGELKEVKQIMKSFEKNPQAAEEFYNSLDVFNDSLVYDKLKDVEIGANERKIIDFEDGSFIVLQSTTEEIPKEISNEEEALVGISSVGPGTTYHTTTPGSSLHTDFEFQIWGVYKAAEYHLNTWYTVNYTNIDITDTDVAGTYAVFPSSITSATSTIVTDLSTSVKSKGNYTLVNGIVIGGQPIGFVNYDLLYTEIAITSVDEHFVYFKVTNTKY